LQGATISYVAPDHLGSPHQITNASKALIWSWDHDPFGNGAPVVAPGVTDNLRFPGQYSDQETGLHYNYFRDYDPRIGRYLERHYNYYRDYDPKLGRYIESDPIGLAGGVNTYGYVGGNPLAYVDPRGLDWSSDFQNYLSESYRHLAEAPRQFMDNPTGSIQSGLESTPGFAPELAAVRNANKLVNAFRASNTANEAVSGSGQSGANCPETQPLLPDSAWNSKAPRQTTPGTKALEGQYINDQGRVEPWKAHYDEYGRQIGRTDYNAGNKSAGVPATHYHTREYNAQFPLGTSTGDHLPGEYGR
jgi:uncharacterized protein RhaS with RHS repeats